MAMQQWNRFSLSLKPGTHTGTQAHAGTHTLPIAIWCVLSSNGIRPIEILAAITCTLWADSAYNHYICLSGSVIWILFHLSALRSSLSFPLSSHIFFSHRFSWFSSALVSCLPKNLAAITRNHTCESNANQTSITTDKEDDQKHCCCWCELNLRIYEASKRK